MVYRNLWAGSEVLPMKQRLEISGMTCEHCRRAAQQALLAVEGVSRAEVSLNPGGAEIEGQVDFERLVEALQEEGFQLISSTPLS